MAAIRRTVEDVFDYVADPRNEPRWLPGAKSVTMTSDGELRRGSTFVGEYARAGRVDLEIVEFVRPSRVTFRARSKIVRFDDAVELAPTEGGGTRLEARMLAEPLGRMRLIRDRCAVSRGESVAPMQRRPRLASVSTCAAI
jgi:uncharacterized protein YndB with AHSA1/START domain